MYASGFKVSALSALVLGAAAATIRIDAGQNGLTFSPDSVTAKVGDILEFHFHPVNHSVVMGDFSDPCQPAKSGGFFSGFLPASSGENKDVFQVTVNSTDPIFFYCSQNAFSHCKSGMSGVVNPSSDQTLDAYKKAAASVSSASNPAEEFGGKLVAASSPSSPSSSASPAPSPTSDGSSSGGGGLYGGSSGGGSKGSAGVNVQASAGVVFLLAVGMAVLIAA